MLFHSLYPKKLDVGCDEAGRGCMSGPVFAAAVILPKNFKNEWLNDSKKLTLSKRIELRKIIEENALSYAVAKCEVEEIDKINILNASILSMQKAINLMIEKGIIPDHISVDGNRFKSHQNIPHTTVIKGDGKYMNIAAASILAKTYRDDWMTKLHEEFPQYFWNENKGYGTKKHVEAMIKYGRTIHHRKSFVLKSQMHLF